MTTLMSEIKKAALIHNPKGVEFKDNKASMLLIAPNHSYHSSAFDAAFDLCRKNGVKYKTVSLHPYTIKFWW